MTDYLCTTILEYEDRFEGQILHVGDKETCESVQKMLPAVAVQDSPIRADMVVAPHKDFDNLECGSFWQYLKKAS